MAHRNTIVSAYQIVEKQTAELRPPLVNLDRNLFPQGSPQPKSLIEITGESNSGKTLLLAHIMAKCLPPTFLGGNYSDILFIDNGHKFSIPRFRKYIKRIISESTETCSPEECETIVNTSLESVTMVSCYSATDFELLFETMDDILLKNRYINLIAVDDIGAFYWQDAKEKLIRMRSHYFKIISKLKRLCEQHNVCCVYTADSNYIKVRNSSHGERPNIGPSPEHRFELKLLADGSRTLNGKTITIDNQGYHFAN